MSYLHFVITNSNNANLFELPQEPFLLKQGSETLPSSFEIEFTQSGKHLIYGFTATKKQVLHEYLKEFTGSKARPNSTRKIFDRKKTQLTTLSKYGFTQALLDDTRNTALLITRAREGNKEYVNAVFDFLKQFNILAGELDETMGFSLKVLDESSEGSNDRHDAVLELLKSADLWIRDFAIEKTKVPSEILEMVPFNDDFKKQLSANMHSSIKTVHAVRDSDQKLIGERMLEMGTHESTGTRKFFGLAAPILDTLANGKVLYIDEFESYLHQDMCQFLVSLFKSENNKNGAQLIINTHDTALMGSELLDREDIFFIEKNAAEESVITPLSGKSVRAGESFEKRYREGIYGAKPHIEVDE